MSSSTCWAKRLQSSASPASFAEALPLWRMSFLTVSAECPPDFASGPSLPQRLRGAFGQALLTRPAWHEARDVFFGDLGRWRPRSDLPKPFVIQAERIGTTVAARLCLFGFADCWRAAAFDAFLLGLRNGIAIDGDRGAQRLPIDAQNPTWTRQEGVPPYAAHGAARLLFRTPVRLGSDGVRDIDAGNLAVSLAERIAGLALWQGLAIDPQLGLWRDLAHAVTLHDRDLSRVTWERRSGAQGGRTIPMSGLIGPLDIMRPPESLLHLLAIGETTHVGGGAALGLGRYDLL